MRLIAHLAHRLEPKDRLADDEVERGLKWLVRNGLGGQVMDTLTVGAFLTAFALQLGASNLFIGILAAMPHVTQVLQLAGTYLADRVRNRRLVSVVAAGFSRPMFLVMAAAALVPDRGGALALLGVGFGLRYTVTALMSPGWNSWMRDLVPEKRMGRFFGRRLMLMTMVGSLLSLAAAAFVDLWPRLTMAPASHAYGILLVGAFLGGAYSVYCMTRVPEPRMVEAEAEAHLGRRLAEPFRDANFRRLMLFLGSWNFAVNLAAPFFAVHMLVRLELDLFTVTLLTMLSQAANITVLRQWGAIADRMSNKSVLAVCAPMFIACIFAWTFTTFPDTHVLTLPLLVAIHVLTGVATAGVTLASGNIALKLAPRGNATAYLADNSLVNSVAAGIAPVFGGLFADFFMHRELSLVLRWRTPGEELAFDTISIAQWDFFFLLATVIGMFSIYHLGRVQEVGEVSERVVLNEILLGLKRSVRNLSSIAGLRTATEFPLGFLRRRPRRSRAAGKADPGTAVEAPVSARTNDPARGGTPGR